MSKLFRYSIIKFFIIISIFLFMSPSYSNSFDDCIKYDSQVTETFKKNWVYKHFPAQNVKKYLNWLEDKKLPPTKRLSMHEVIVHVLKQCVSIISSSK